MYFYFFNANIFSYMALENYFNYFYGPFALNELSSNILI